MIFKVLSFFVVILSISLSFYAYDKMPEKMASHWNEMGEVDGYMTKTFALFIMPSISIILFLFFLAIPKIDPLKENIKKFINYYEMFFFAILLFLLYISFLIIAWNIGFSFNMIQLLIPAFACLFYCCGLLLERVERNWFIGVRTPCTLSSEKVWEKTNKLGAKLFKISSIIILFGLFFYEYAFLILIFSILVSIVYLIVYSYYEYQKGEK